jgi:hypothetical protein
MANPVVKIVGKIAKEVIKKNSKKTLMPKLTKKSATKASSRQDGDYATSGKSAKQLMPKAGKADTTSPSGKQFIRGGSAQVMNQNARLTKPLTKAEIKANARGLKAANKKTNKVGSKADRTERKIVNKNFNTPAKYSYVKQLRRDGSSPRKTTRGK